MLDNMFMDFSEDQMQQGFAAPATEPDPPTKKKQEGTPINLYVPKVDIQYGTTSPGASMPVKDKDVPLYEANTSWLSARQKNMDDNDLEYAQTLFTSLNTLPLINNKPVPLSELSTAMSDPKKRKAIMDQAYKLDDNPELDPDTKWKLIENHYKNVMLGSIIMEGNKRITEDLYRSATIRDAKKEGTLFTYSSLFNKDKQFVSEEEWELRQVNKLTEDYNNQVLSYNIKNYKPSSIMQSFYAAQRRDKGFVDMDESPKPMVPINLPGSKLNFNKFKEQQVAKATEDLQMANAKVLDPFTAKNYKSSPFYKKVQGLYGKYKQAVLEQYNASYDPANLGPNSARKLSADVEGKFSGNKGGMYHSPIMTMGFDFSKPMVVADEIIEDPNTGEVSIKKNAQVMDEGVKEAANLFKFVQSNPNDVKIDLGGIKDKVPDESWGRGQEAVQAIITQLMAGHKKGNLIPKGSITFQGIVGGEDKFHAYHVKLAPTFFSHDTFAGKGKLGKQDDGKTPNNELINNGFTIYIPSEKSVKQLGFGKKYKSATSISPVEAMLNWKNEVELDIPEGGRIHLIKDAKTGEISMNGYGVVLNPNTMSFSDTIRINPDNSKFGSDAATDIDAILKKNLEVIKMNWYRNQKQKSLMATPGSIGNQ